MKVFYRYAPENDRYFPGDRHLIPFLRRLLNVRRVSGTERVVLNLCQGLRNIGVPVQLNPDVRKIKKGDRVVVLGFGKYAMHGIPAEVPLIAGIGLMTHPAEWPDLCREYNVRKYLQHSEWARAIYVPWFGEERCALWPAGIDTAKWRPSAKSPEFEVLIYNKIRWNHDARYNDLLHPVVAFLDSRGLRWRSVRYGDYEEREYRKLLDATRAIVYITEHESQGFAACEAMAMNVPVFAWDPGFWHDPNRHQWQEREAVPALTVPFFDERCGGTFAGFDEFQRRFDGFWAEVAAGTFQPRAYIEENLTLERSAHRMLDLFRQIETEEK